MASFKPFNEQPTNPKKRSDTFRAAKPWLAAWVIASVGLVGGLFAFTAVSNMRLKLDTASAEQDTIAFHEQRQHLVTAEMQRASNSLSGQDAWRFTGTGLSGRKLDLVELSANKPVLLFFVELHCPCCRGAKPYIDRVQKAYGDVCSVIGVINADEKLARAWANTVKPKFDVLPDPEMNAIRGYKAIRGVYTTLIAPGGRIVKAYPGYSRTVLREISQKIATLAGIKERPLELYPAPKTITSGCLFPGTELPEDQI